MPPAVELRGIRKSFGENEVLRGIDLAIEPGTIFGYVGPNGAGKTTTVRILTGLLADFEGEARVAGVDVRDDALAVKRRIGYVPETIALYEGLSAREYLELVGRLRRLPEGSIGSRVDGLVELFGLGDRIHDPLRGFSKGMRQKIMLASALIHDPEILFLDEPLSGLDVASALLVKDLLRALADRGRTVLYCSHIMDVVERTCDRIAVLDDGRIVDQGSFDDLASRSSSSSLEAVFRKLTGTGDTTDRVRRALDVVGGELPGGPEPRP